MEYYTIAGLTVAMHTFGRTELLARPYRAQPDTPADITIVPNYEILKRQRPGISDDACEYIASGRSFYGQLIDFDGFMLHASAIAVDGKAYLFSADSGTGKSTHTALWRQVLGSDRVTILNDDKPALRRINGIWYACGTPWCGKDGLNQNLCCPIAGICFLERSPVNRIVPYEKPDVLFRFLNQTYRFVNSQTSEKLLQLLGSLMEAVPLWQLECNMDPSAAQLSYAAMAARNTPPAPDTERQTP